MIQLIVARQCEGPIPNHFLGMEFIWPNESRDFGTNITYTCPYRRSTFENDLIGNVALLNVNPLKKCNILMIFLDQYINCIWDKDTDELIWWPQTILECNRK